MDLEKYIGVVPDHPKPGISFKDISPLLRNSKAFKYCINQLYKKVKKYKPTVIVAPESRAFVFAIALAQKMKIGMVMARKRGKLPGKVISYDYTLEYGNETLQVQEGAFNCNDRVLLIDDIMATGGTLSAVKELVKKVGGTPIACACPITLIELKGWETLNLPFETILYLSDSH